MFMNCARCIFYRTPFRLKRATRILQQIAYADKQRIFCTTLITAASTKSNAYAPEKALDFEQTFAALVKMLRNECEECPEVGERLSKSLEYNVPHGKKLFAAVTVALYKQIEDPDRLTDENVFLANILGWCMQMVHTSSLIYDDLEDSSETRHGALCWYLLEDVGIRAVNDARLVLSCVYAILRRYFRGSHCYVPIMELLQDSVSRVTMGQALDLALKSGAVELDSFDMKMYDTLVEYKTACLFRVPVMHAMYLRGGYEPEVYKQVGDIFFEIGKYYQVQNDYLDCFGHPDVTGNKGTDIETGACSWLIVQAVQRATEVERELLRKSYGRPNKESVMAVRCIYEELGLRRAYDVYEKETYSLLRGEIGKVSDNALRQFLCAVLESIHGRNS
ncbi:hypothetical protein PPYR_03657 [Photinus pyralis]|uniref:Farnesyl pyrophosphate synthase n=1 Tax=Photinus pyralis TaxID=7054 RepID=A0A5N4A3G6_PHOPY|nr:farnesyl pyrophosphate synthase-like isoform X2 [Photinus pyralis]KAB0791857.1 hypothetical protein PPYR_03657 [Photinus pyralis]